MMRALLMSALCLLMVCCVRPDTEEIFISESKADGGLYEFSFDMPDTLSTYDFAFFARVDRPSLGKTATGAFPLKVCWLSPDSRKALEEQVWFDAGDLRGVQVDYRKGVRPSQAGSWKMLVRPEDPPKGLRGMGLIIKRNDGTR